MSGIVTTSTISGHVSSASRNRVWVTMDSEACTREACTGGCGSCGGKTGRKRILVETDQAEKFPVGSRVFVHHSHINEAVGAAIVFGIPLFFTFLVLVVWHTLAPSRVESGYALLSAGGAFFTGLLTVRIIDRVFRSRFPSVIELNDHSTKQLRDA